MRTNTLLQLDDPITNLKSWPETSDSSPLVVCPKKKYNFRFSKCWAFSKSDSASGQPGRWLLIGARAPMLSVLSTIQPLSTTQTSAFHHSLNCCLPHSLFSATLQHHSNLSFSPHSLTHSPVPPRPRHAMVVLPSCSLALTNGTKQIVISNGPCIFLPWPQR